MNLACLAACLIVSPAEVEHQRLEVRIDPESSRIEGVSAMTIATAGDLPFRIHPEADIELVLVSGTPVEVEDSDQGRVPFVPGVKAGDEVVFHWNGTHLEDVAAGERPGRIHNQSVRAHAATDGVFLSDGSAWHPQPLDDRGRPQLRTMSIELEPIAGWTLVASGDPDPTSEPSAACWSWRTPRPVNGMAVAGNRHRRFARSVETDSGNVDVVVQISETNASKAGYYLDASEAYLDRYTNLLGPYPYDRFSVVENFFSSGFAFPGFTLLGPRVVGMAPRSLKPGYLDHELVHAWWGNGVYVDPDDGNWCEGLTSFCTNYGRRVLEEGAEAGRRYRRGIINQVSLDPTLDNGPVGEFGRLGRGIDRFVGYEKSAFVFMMLADVLEDGREDRPFEEWVIWEVLRSIASDHLGERIGWGEIQLAAEAAKPDRAAGWLDPFFQRWVRDHDVPKTTSTLTARPPQSIDRIVRNDGTEVFIDPQSRHYRIVPISLTSPTIGGTIGGGIIGGGTIGGGIIGGGTSVMIADGIPASAADLAWVSELVPGDNHLLIGRAAIDRHADLIARTSDPIDVDDAGFTVGGERWNDPSQSILHTMHHPDHPGRYITVFHSNGDAGWRRIRLAWYYRKDTTVVWEGDQTRLRRIHEPDAWMPVDSGPPS